MPRPKGYVVSAETKAKIAAAKAATRVIRLEVKTRVRSIGVSAIVTRKPTGYVPGTIVDKKWGTKLWNKGVVHCPNCGFPEAYGLFCNECGWFAKDENATNKWGIRTNEKGTTMGPRWDLISRREVAGKARAS